MKNKIIKYINFQMAKYLKIFVRFIFILFAYINVFYITEPTTLHYLNSFLNLLSIIFIIITPALFIDYKSAFEQDKSEIIPLDINSQLQKNEQNDHHDQQKYLQLTQIFKNNL